MFTLPLVLDSWHVVMTSELVSGITDPVQTKPAKRFHQSLWNSCCLILRWTFLKQRQKLECNSFSKWVLPLWAKRTGYQSQCSTTLNGLVGKLLLWSLHSYSVLRRSYRGPVTNSSHECGILDGNQMLPNTLLYGSVLRLWFFPVVANNYFGWNGPWLINCKWPKPWLVTAAKTHP